MRRRVFQSAKTSKVKFLRLERVTRVGWNWAVVIDKDRDIRFLSTVKSILGDLSFILEAMKTS